MESTMPNNDLILNQIFEQMGRFSTALESHGTLLSEIKVQVTRTNGRVTALEETNKREERSAELQRQDDRRRGELDVEERNVERANEKGAHGSLRQLFKDRAAVAMAGCLVGVLMGIMALQLSRIEMGSIVKDVLKHFGWL